MKNIKIGFISSRIAGMDNVSVEAKKWADVLEEEGHSCFYMAGELDTKLGKNSLLVQECGFDHPQIAKLRRLIFKRKTRTEKITSEIHELSNFLSEKIRLFVNMFDLNLIVAENALSIPLNLPLSLAITNFISEAGVDNIKIIAHHHDLIGELESPPDNKYQDLMDMAFPSHPGYVQHVVFSSKQDKNLAINNKVSSAIIPYVADFENSPEPLGKEDVNDLRQAIGVKIRK